jgi:RNA polymerase sigma-70 factor (ECF subfamily)
MFMVGDADVAQDVVQETFVRVWMRRRALRSGLSILGYVLKISGNLVRDQMRHREVRAKLAGDVPPPSKSEGDDPADALDLRNLEDRIAVIIRRDLPERCRQIFLLSRTEGKSQREIADLLGIRVKTVENQINHALRVLRKKLGRP